MTSELVDQVRLHHLAIPLKGAFHTGLGGIDSRDIVLVEVRIGGHPGWGEASPYPGQDESIDDVIAAVAGGPVPVTLSSAIEFAVADAEARVAGVSLASEIGAERTSVPASIAVSLGGDPGSVVGRAFSLGVERFKLKIAPGHVQHVFRIVEDYPNAVIGVDANGSFDDRTVDELVTLEDLPLVYLEQPCHPSSTPVLERIRTIMDIPVFMDESVRTVADARTMLGSAFVDGVVVKPGRLGLTGCLETIGEAQRVGKRWRASGLLESGVGRSYTDILAGLPSAFLSDVAPAEWFLESDVVPSRFESGCVSLPAGHGIGVSPDTEVMGRYEIASYEAPDLFRRLAGRDLG